VDLIAAHRYDVNPAEIRRICGIKPANEEQQTNAIIGNMVRVVDALHDPSSQMLRALKTAVTDGSCAWWTSPSSRAAWAAAGEHHLAEIFAHTRASSPRQGLGPFRASPSWREAAGGTRSRGSPLCRDSPSFPG